MKVKKLGQPYDEMLLTTNKKRLQKKQLIEYYRKEDSLKKR